MSQVYCATAQALVPNDTPCAWCGKEHQLERCSAYLDTYPVERCANRGPLYRTENGIEALCDEHEAGYETA